MSTERVCCATCGGLNVQYAVWYSPNDREVCEPFGTWNHGDNTFCADCDEHTDLVDKYVDPEAFALARSKRARVPCPSCTPTESQTNHVTGHVFLGGGLGWRVCVKCHGAGVIDAPPDGTASPDGTAA